MTDVVIIAAWFMLKEIELGSALLKDLGLTATHVAIDVPLHKTAPGGECVMTRRRLECACGVQVQPLCPFHAAQRHMLRLRLRGSTGQDDPLLPAQDGGFMPKHAVIHKFGQVCRRGVELTYTDPNSRQRQLFGGQRLGWQAPPSWQLTASRPQ